MKDTLFDPPEVSGSVPFINNLDSAPAYWLQDALSVVLVHGDETDGRYSLMHETLRKGAAAPLHTHSRSDEHFYILAGEVTFLVGDDIWIGRAGDFIYVPRNTPHAYRVDSDEAVFLNGYTPSGLEIAITDQARPAPRLDVPPHGATGPTDPGPGAMHRYGMDLISSPNPLDP